MHIFNPLSRHRPYEHLADAFVDGELRGDALREFQAHLTACGRCEASVAAARTFKAAVAALPELSSPRSFQLTPAMVAAPARPAKAHQSGGTPIYLGFARAGAALSVGAFAAILAITALETSDQQSADDATASRELMADAAAPVASASGTAAADTDTFSATPEATSPIAPATTGGAAGAGVPTATAPLRAPATGPGPDSPTPVPPSTGVDSASPIPQETSRNGALESPIAGSPSALETFESVPGGALIEPYNPSSAPKEDDDTSPWLLPLGILAALSVGILGAVEVTRRARK